MKPIARSTESCIVALSGLKTSAAPAVLNKNVLSQVDGLIAMKLTSSQDRDAIGAWIEGQADREDGRRILATLPTMSRGSGVIWLPGRAILETQTFPDNMTFDSSQTPKRGENKHDTILTPLDLPVLKERLAAVEIEMQANDPKALHAEIVRLKRDIHEAKQRNLGGYDPTVIEDADRCGYARGRSDATIAADNAVSLFQKTWNEIWPKLKRMEEAYEVLGEWRKTVPVDDTITVQPKHTAAPEKVLLAKLAVSRAPSNNASDLTGPQRQLLQALAWWREMGHNAPTRVQVAVICGWRITSGHLKNVSGSLRTAGLIDYPSERSIALTDAGAHAAPAPNMGASLEDSVIAILSGPQRLAFARLPKNGKAISRDVLAEGCGWEPTSGHVKNVLGSMRSLELIDYPQQGHVARAKWLMS